jgi:hypothetical protein
VNDPLKPLTNRLLELAVTLLTVVLALRWAWQLFRPLLPALVVFIAAGVGLWLAVRHYRSRW